MYTRAHGDMIEVLMHLHVAYSVSQCLLIIDDNPARTRDHSLRRKKIRFARNTTSKFLVIEKLKRGIYNTVVTVPSVSSFKQRL